MSTIRNSLVAVFLAAVLICGCSSDKPTESTPEANDDNLVILRSSSPHFNYYCTLRDVAVIDTIRVLLETNLQRASALYNFSINDTIDVKIYPDFETFHDNVEWPTDDIPSTLVGQCVNGYELKIISPLNSEPVNSYSEMLIVVVHESMHAFHFHITGAVSGSLYPPAWLFEGFAVFEANQRPNRDLIRQRIADGDLPLIEQYENPDFFNANYGYHFCYTIHEYLLSAFGYDRVSVLLKYPNQIAYSLGTDVTMATLNAGWHEFLLANYSE